MNLRHVLEESNSENFLYHNIILNYLTQTSKQTSKQTNKLGSTYSCSVQFSCHISQILMI